MILRAAALASGMMGAAISSQFPEFSQQYTQRLGGAVDALAEVVADFDASAAASGLTRMDALAQLQGTEFLDRRRTDMTRTFMRYDKLSADITALEGQGPFMRAYNLPRFGDAEIRQAAWGAYQPALPLNFAGMTFAGIGFLLFGSGLAIILRLLSWPFRGRTKAA